MPSCSGLNLVGAGASLHITIHETEYRSTESKLEETETGKGRVYLDLPSVAKLEVHTFSA